MFKSYLEIRRRARELRRNMTETERRFWYKFFSTLSVRWQRQKIIGGYIADFYCHSAALVVEFDGSQHYTDEQIKYDTRRTAYFKSKGLEVIRFSNLEANENFYIICEVIYNKMMQRIRDRSRHS